MKALSFSNYVVVVWRGFSVTKLRAFGICVPGKMKDPNRR
jgi:hypothetical protein